MRQALSILFLVPLIAASAQATNTDCASAALLCAQQPTAGDNTGVVNAAPAPCPPADHVLWYTFTTNSVGGSVDVRLSAIDCSLVPGFDDELSVVVLAGNTSCALNGFTTVSPCGLDDQSFTTTTSISLLPSTQYWITVAGAANSGAAAECGFNINISGPGADIIGVDFDAGPDVEIPEGGAAQLGVTGGTTYTWSPTSGLSGTGIPDPIANPLTSTSYAVSTAINGCTFSDTVLVDVVLLIDPPNTFSPNEDGINDVWEVPGIADFPGSEVVIYDRWGQRVFNSNGYREPWDGTHNGKDLSEGTYYYYIQLNEVEGRSDPYTGFISLIR